MAIGDLFMTGRSGAAPNGQLRIGCSPASKMIADEELLRLLLLGMTVREAAGHMRSSYGRCCKVARSPQFLLRLREQSGEIAKRMVDELSTTQIEFAHRLEEASAQALEEMMSMMDELETPSNLKYKIAQDLLDRDPRASRTKRLEASATHEFINPEVLQRAATAAREISRTQIIDVESSPINGDGTGHPDNGGNG